MKTLHRRDRGSDVVTLQRLLDITPDGIFGSQTEAAVKQYQAAHGLIPDGICGPKTWAALTSRPVSGDATPTSHLDSSWRPCSAGIDFTDGHITTHITRCPARKPEYIAIHYTAGTTSRRGAAMATRSVFLNRRASADFVVDDSDIILINPDIRNCYCWAVGDKKNPYSGGARLHGKATNRNTISIEICSNLKAGTTPAVPNHSGWYFTEQSLDNALRLVRYLMRKYGIPKANVVRHYDISGKPCPGIIGWNDAQMYDTDSKATAKKNNSDEWKKFWESI